VREAASAWRRSSSRLWRALTAESDRWFLWVPVLFAGGVLAYFALSAEPSAIAATALLIAATGTALAVRGLGLGLVVGTSLLALAAGFATAKLRTEVARAGSHQGNALGRGQGLVGVL
jgi:competence protein ComEC